ncbi:hypothetical protein NKG94_07705 [Micromonospora sp. M12]
MGAELAAGTGHRPARPRRLLRSVPVVSGALTEETVSAGRLRPRLLSAGSGRRFGPGTCTR